MEETCIYHAMTKSIAGFKIFNSKNDYLRIINLFKFFQKGKRVSSSYRFKEFLKSQTTPNARKIDLSGYKNVVTIIAYCVMPTHLHLILKEIREGSMSIFMSNVLNGYTRYFNVKHDRKGPLWEGRFKKVLVENDEQLLHLTRYIHLNPATASLVEDPRKWVWSSYQEYLGMINSEDRMCQFNNFLDIDQASYGEFVTDRISYQKELSEIKKVLLD